MATTAPAANDAALNLFIDTDQLEKDVVIDSTDLSGNMAHHARLYFHYAKITVRARAQYERWKSATEILESSLDSTHRLTLREAYEAEIGADPKSKAKPPTEGQVRAAIVTDPKYKAAAGRLIEAQQVWKLAEAAERAFEHRKDMLIQIARDASREQAGGELRVMANRNAAGAKERLLSTMQANA